MKYSLPTKNKEFILYPPINEIRTLVESNQRLLSHIEMEKIPFFELRTQLRQSIFDEKPIVACGHQPIIYHPGILFKDMVVNALMKKYGFAGLNLVVDSDTLGSNQSISIPSFENGLLRCKEIQLFYSPKNLALEEIPPPHREEFNQNLNYIQRSLKDLLPQENLKSLKDYIAITHRVFENSENLAQFNASAKRLFEERLGFIQTEVFLSFLCQSRAFIYFISLILSSAKQFVSSYNTVLDEYRRERKIRDFLRPVPNLKLSRDIVELPFWIWREGEERTTFYLKFNRAKICICSGEREIIDIAGKKIDLLVETIEKLKGFYKIRPKVLMLTLFVRLFLCDLWIHGIGGSEYEKVNDRLAQDFLSITLPQYAIASATLYLNLNLPIITDDDLKGLKDTLRRMKFNPEKFLDKTDNLIKTKEDLIRQMKGTQYKKELHHQLTLIDKKLRDKCISQIQNLEKDIMEKEKLKEIATKREFPFFIFCLNDFKSLFEKLMVGSVTEVLEEYVILEDFRIK